ncbi:MAG: peptidoglycan DD-metalloendopeptidase family protein [Alphaproteobacteria bacterium]
MGQGSQAGGLKREGYRWARGAAAMAGVLALALCLVIALVMLAPRGSDDAPAPAAAGAAHTVPKPPQKDIRTIEMERGDTLGGLLLEEGARAEDATGATAALAPVFNASALRGGQSMTLVFEGVHADTSEPVLRSVAFQPSVERDIAIERQPDGRYAVRDTVKTLTAKGARVRGTIKGSLYQSALDAGVPDGVIVDMIRIYSHAVDFQREIRAGDSFDILFTTYTDEAGQPLKSGAIDFAQLTLSGEAKPLYRFTSVAEQTTDYYTPDGKSGRRLLMRTPIDGARLSSGFGMRRHPVLGYSKMHKGVDFAAPTGTPIMAAGNGTIRMARWNGSFGKYVRIAHANGYETAYAHLSRIAPGVREGARVRQGQVIGRVGTTGRSTGPHLHYEVMVRNRQINPMDVKLPTGTTLAGAELAAFKAMVARVNLVLDKWGETPAVVAQGEILRAKLLP